PIPEPVMEAIAKAKAAQLADAPSPKYLPDASPTDKVVAASEAVKSSATCTPASAASDPVANQEVQIAARTNPSEPAAVQASLKQTVDASAAESHPAMTSSAKATVTAEGNVLHHADGVTAASV